MKKILILVLIFISISAGATNYYVSTSGNDSNNGLTTGTAWRTLGQVNDYSSYPGFSPGDTIKFRKGDTFRGYIWFSSSGAAGNPIVLTSYGAGVQPVISSAADYSSYTLWSNYSGNIWRTGSISTAVNEIGTIVYNNSYTSAKRYSIGACTSQGNFFYDQSDGRVYMYSAGNPGNYYQRIDIGGVYAENVITIAYRNYVTIDGLHIQNSANNGVFINRNHHIVVQNCEINWIGGMFYQCSPPNACHGMGNGVQMWEEVDNITVQNNYIHDCYDTGVSPQGNGTYTQSNIYIHHNIFNRCYWTYEIFVGGDYSARTLTNIRFEHNTCMNASSWSEAWRPDQGAATHVKTWQEANATRSGLTIKNNIFYVSNNTAYSHYYSNVFDSDYNLFYVNIVGFIFDTDYYSLSSWRSVTGDDYHSVSADPLIDSGGNIQAGSPAIDAGTDLGYTTDYYGNPISGSPDIGAVEYQAAVTKYANLVIEGHSFVAPTTWGEYYLEQQTNTYAVYNSGQGGSHIVDAEYPNVEERASTVDAHLVTETNALKNILVLWIGVNDMSYIEGEGVHTYQELKSYVIDRVNAGWKVFAFTITPTNAYGRGAQFEIERQYVNGMMRTDLENVANVKVLNTDALTVLNDPSNTTYYTDGLHLSQTGSALACALFGDAMTEFWLGEPIPEPPIPPVPGEAGYFRMGSKKFYVIRNGAKRYLIKNLNN